MSEERNGEYQGRNFTQRKSRRYGDGSPPIDQNDIELEEKTDQYYDDRNGDYNGRSNPRDSKYRQSRGYTGEPMESLNSFKSKGSPGRRRTEIVSSPSGGFYGDSDGDMNGTSRDLNDFDVKSAMNDFDETNKIHDVLKKVEKDFSAAKQVTNQQDINLLSVQIQIQTVKQCYGIIKDNMFDENPNFDQEKMEHNIDSSFNRVLNTYHDFSKFKGEFLGVSETVINKDILTFKLERVTKQKQKLDLILQKLPQQDGQIGESTEDVKNIRLRYQKFEKVVFEKKLQDTQYQIKDTDKLIEKIESQAQRINQDLKKVKQEIEGFTPQNKDQRAKLNSIQTILADADAKMEKAEGILDSDLKDREILFEGFESNSKITVNIKAVDLLPMAEQSRQIKKLVQNHIKWVQLYKRLKLLADDEFPTIEMDLQKALQDARKFLDALKQNRADEFDDLIKRIQKVAKKVNDETDVQQERLKDFEETFLVGKDKTQQIADVDLMFLRKEVARYNSALVGIHGIKDKLWEDSVKIGEKDMQKPIKNEDLFVLKQNLKGLEKMDTVDVPRITKAIDALEGFSVKALKNILNEDNKRSQAQISKMKKNYEDLQKYIDALNGKIGKVSDSIDALKEEFNNEDYEKDNEFVRALEDKLDECDKDVNGDDAERKAENRALMTDQEERKFDGGRSEKEKSLQGRKKQIIAAINKMVNLFNENNKLIKESNKVQKTERDMKELIQRNKEIQDDCKFIDEKVNDGKEFAAVIDKKLDMLMDPVIPKIKEKYADKANLIDQCDEAFDKADAQVNDLEGKLGDQLDKLDDIIKRLEAVSPINMPTGAKDDAARKFADKVADKIKQANLLRDEGEGVQKDIGKSKDKLMDIIAPLNELAEREVKTPEIEKVLKGLQAINKNLGDFKDDIKDLEKKVNNLQDDVDDLLEGDKERKIDEAQRKLAELDAKIGDLNLERADAAKHLKEYQDLIEDAKEEPGKSDPVLLQKLKKLEGEAKQIGKELRDNDEKAADLKKKRNDGKKLLEDIKQQPQKFLPKNIDDLIQNFDDQKEKADELCDKAKEIDDELIDRIKDLKDLIRDSQEKNGIQDKLGALMDEIKEGLKKSREVLDKYPNLIDLMIATNDEMKIGAVPDETADYWEERKTIDRHLGSLKEDKDKLNDLDKKHLALDKQTANTMAQIKKNPEIETMKDLIKTLDKQAAQIDTLVNDVFDVKDEVDDIKKQMGECEIPVNIAMRRSELEQLGERLDRISDDFRDLQQADSDFDGSVRTEQDIKDMIKEIEQRLKGFVKEFKGYKSFQKDPLEIYKEKDFVSYKNQPIIIEVRDQKKNIADINKRLKDLEDLLNDLNNKLILQDMDNATKLLEKKAVKLRERLQAAKDELKKIAKCGEEMDGNTTHNEEEEFIDALKDEMPEVFKNIEANFDQLDDIDDLLKDVKDNKNIDAMGKLKKEIDDVTVKVEQSEGLVNKLENEIIEWDAHRKLCRRDEELEEIQTLLFDFKDDLGKEAYDMDGHKEKKQDEKNKTEDPKKIGEVEYMIENIDQYKKDIKDLLEEVDDLDELRDKCFEEFDLDIPYPVRDERKKRGANKGRKGALSPRGAPVRDRNYGYQGPITVYYMIHVNCKYRKRIHSLLKELRLINQRRRELEEKYGPLKRDLRAIKTVKAYKAIKGDKIDELFAQHLNAHSLNLTVKRLAAGQYMFGSRKIIAKIINGNLLIRVGGGYMSADEFIEQYGRMEMLKMMKAQDPDFDVEKAQRMASTGRGSVGRGSQAQNIGDMKAMMRESMANIKTYGPGDSYTEGESARDKTSKFKGKNLLDLEGSYNAVKFGTQNTSPKAGAAGRGSPKGLSGRAGSGGRVDSGLGSPNRRR